MVDRTVPELARETLKQLIIRKMAPTPANYRSVFNELGNLSNDPPFPVDQLRKIAQALPTQTPGQQKQRSLIEYAVSQFNWQGVQDALVAYGSFTPRNSGGFEVPANGAVADAGVDGTLAHNKQARASAPALTTEFFEQIARLIEFTRPALGADDLRFAEQTTEVLRAMREPGADAVQVKQLLSTYAHRV